jgi:hypothetical protein
MAGNSEITDLSYILSAVQRAEIWFVGLIDELLNADMFVGWVTTAGTFNQVTNINALPLVYNHQLSRRKRYQATV